jgi:hypothetical protein
MAELRNFKCPLTDEWCQNGACKNISGTVRCDDERRHPTPPAERDLNAENWRRDSRGRWLYRHPVHGWRVANIEDLF